MKKKEKQEINFEKLHNDRVNLYVDSVIKTIADFKDNIPKNNKELENKIYDELLKSYIKLEQIIEDI